MSCVSAFNEMDENHDGKISQSEFVEVKIRICVPGIQYCVTGLYGSEEILHHVDPQDHRRLHHGGPPGPQ